MMDIIKPIKYLLITVFVITFIGLTSCKDKTPQPSQPSVVKKKIATNSTPAATKETASATGTMATSQKPKTESQNPTDAKPATSQQPASGAQPSQASPNAVDTTNSSSGLIEESRLIASTYDPKGRFDPFEPLFKEQPEVQVVTASKDKRKKRVPQTPLERVAISQLKLTAIIQAPSGNRGLVVDATGKGYVVEKGTYIGLNSGRVIDIEKDRIVIEEDIEDIMGEMKTQNSELKLLKPAGEL
jgi:type IV pilus assembly protein PilP